MEDICTYQVEVRDQVDENELNVVGLLQVRVVRGEADSTVFTVRTDQSGIIGLMRHLNGRGMVILAVRHADAN